MNVKPLRNIVILFFLVVSAACFGQYHDNLLNDGFDLVNKKEYAKALEIGTEVYGVFPDNIKASIICAFSLINLNRVDEAGPYINVGLKQEPTNFPIQIDAGYYFAATGNLESAKAYLIESMKVFPKELDIAALVAEMREVGINLNKAAIFNELASWYEQTKRNSSTRYPTAPEMFEAYGEGMKSGPQGLKAKASQFADAFHNLNWPEMVLFVYANAAWWLNESGHVSDAAEMAQSAYAYYLKNGCRENFDIAGFMYLQLMDAQQTLGDHERVVQYNKEIIELSPKLLLHVNDVKCLELIASSYDRLDNNAEARKFAVAAYKVAELHNYKYGLASAANTICAAYNYITVPEDLNTSIAYGEAALKMALEYKLEDLSGSIIANLALGYWKTGTKEGLSNSLRLHGSLVKIHKDKKNYGQAALTLNNAGAIMFAAENYDYAVKLFEESIALGEINSAGLSFEEKLTFYQSQISAYQFLTACYAKLNNAQKAFDMMEGSRSRVLSERLSKGRGFTKATLADLQAKLQPDEACIMYSLFSAHEVIILVVTKKYANVMFHSDNSFIGDIKEKYLDRMNKEHRERTGIAEEEVYDPDNRVVRSDFVKVTQLTRKFFENPGMADHILDEYLKGYFRFLILPVSHRLTGIKKLLISPDDVLNFVPYEALKLQDGKYLVEKYDISYMHSASVLQQLESRKYSANRKPLLALGGAVFQPMNIAPRVISTQQDLNRLRLEVELNEESGSSQRVAYATLFGTEAMNYLPGTVEEIKNVAAVVPGAEIYLGEQMTENRIKAMSESGVLSQYKIFHLATHGFVVNEIPALSGVATSVFATESGGEDGFLNVAEISNLNVNADLTILSACQTALGKIYSGEGVTGLTQSLLVAGSNAALVSLWPVNDTSTMLFMSGLYTENAKGKSFEQVVNELKRKFIKGDYGDQFRHPNFWAPFIYVGK